MVTAAAPSDSQVDCREKEFEQIGRFEIFGCSESFWVIFDASFWIFLDVFVVVFKLHLNVGSIQMYRYFGVH